MRDRPTPPTWRAWKARNGRRWRRYPLVIEWVFEWINHGLHQWAFVEFLEYAGRFTVLVVAIVWFLEADDRTKQSHYRAWELINTARGSTGDGGRKDALQDLNKDHVSLAAAPLEKAYLPEVNLKGADLGEARLQGAILREANLEGADLQRANLQDADLGTANLQDANLSEANLQGASLSGYGANLAGAKLWRANLHGADLNEAILHGADLQEANLQDANISEAGLGGAYLRDAKNLTQEQLDAADGDDDTLLPEGLTRPAHWSTQPSESPPPAQPDDAGRAPAASGAPGSDE